MEITTTNINLGIKEDTVKPYKDDISSCFLLGAMLSNLIFNTKIEMIRPIVKNQKALNILYFKMEEAIGSIIDLSHKKAKESINRMAKHNRTMEKKVYDRINKGLATGYSYSVAFFCPSGPRNSLLRLLPTDHT